jgi:hypothetical protein
VFDSSSTGGAEVVHLISAKLESAPDPATPLSLHRRYWRALFRSEAFQPAQQPLLQQPTDPTLVSAISEDLAFIITHKGVCPSLGRLAAKEARRLQAKTQTIEKNLRVKAKRVAKANSGSRVQASSTAVTSRRGEVQLGVRFSGSTALPDNNISVFLDDEPIGAGTGWTGVDLSVNTTPGAHKLRLKAALLGKSEFDLQLDRPGIYQANLSTNFRGRFKCRLERSDISSASA